MPQRTFLGYGKKVVQVEQGVPVSIVAGSILRVRFRDAVAHYIEYTCMSSNVATCVAGLAAAWNASTDPLFCEVTASNNDWALILTCDIPGKPFGPVECVSSGMVNLGGARSEIQRIAEPTQATTGSFTLGFRNQTTISIDHNANSDVVEAALQALTSIGSGGITATSPLPGVWVINFGGDLARQNVPAITAQSALNGYGNVLVAEVTEGKTAYNFTQAFAYTIEDPAEGGTWVALWNGIATAGIPYNATDAQIQQAFTDAFGLERSPMVCDVEVFGTSAVVSGFSVVFTANPGTILGPAFTTASYMTEYTDVIVALIQDGEGAENEVKSYIIPTTVTGGEYNLVLGGETTGNIGYDWNSVQVQAELEALSTIGAGNISVTQADTTFRMTWQGNYAQENIGAMTSLSTMAADVSLTPTSLTTGVSGDDERQTLVQGWTGGGTWTVTFRGATSGSIACNSNSAVVTSALEGVSTIGTGNIQVTGPYGSGTYTIIYRSALHAQNVPTMTGAAWWTGRAGVIAVEELTPGMTGEKERQRVTFTGASSGVYALSFNGETTGYLTWNQPVGTIKTNLEEFVSIATVTVSGTFSNYTVTFDETTISGDQPMMVFNSSLSGQMIGTMGTSEATKGASEVPQKPRLEDVVWSGLTEGAFYIDYLGTTTGDLAFDASYQTVSNALSNLDIGSNVESAGGGARWSHTYAGQNTACTSDNPGVVITTYQAWAALVSAVDERQSIVFTGVTSGVYSLSFTYGGYTADTSGIAWNATDAQVQTALAALSTIGTGNVGVTGTYGSGFIVTFIEARGGQDVDLLGFTKYFGTLTVSYGVSEEVKGGVTANEVQRLWFVTAPTGGTYSMTFSAVTSTNIAHNANAPTIQSALEGISTIGTSNIAVTDSTLGGFAITFKGALKWAPQPELSATTTALVLPTPAPYSWVNTQGKPGTDAIQFFAATTTPNAGTFSLTFDGSTTSSLTFNTTAAQVDAALEALASVGTNNVQVSGASIASGFTIAYRLALGSDPQDLIGVNSALAVGYLPTITTETEGGSGGTPEKQTITIPAIVTRGSFTLTFNSEPSSMLSWNANALQLQGALEALETIGTGNITVAKPTPTISQWVATFANDLTGLDHPPIEIQSYLGGPNLANIYGQTNGVEVITEVQSLRLDNINAGSWQLGRNKVWSSYELSYDAGAETVRAAYMAISGTYLSPTVVKTTTTNTATYMISYPNALGTQLLLSGRPFPFYPQMPVPPAHNDARGFVARMYAGQPEQSAKQQVLITDASGGTLQLSFQGQTTYGLYRTSNAAQVEEALAALSTIGTGQGQVTVTSPTIPTCGDWRITFGGTLANTALEKLGSINYLTPTFITVRTEIDQQAQDGRDAWHVLDFGGLGGCLLYLIIDGVTMPQHSFWNPWNPGWGLWLGIGTTYDILQGYFDADPRCAGNVTVGGGPVGTNPIGFRFHDGFGKRQLDSTIWDILYKGTGITSFAGTNWGADPKNQHQWILCDNAPTSGTYRLTFRATGTTLNWNANAATIKTALESLPTIRPDNLSVTGSLVNTVWPLRIEWISMFAQTVVPAIEVASYLPSTTPTSLVVSDLLLGGAAQNEIEVFTIIGNPMGGTIKLYVNDSPSNCVDLPYNPTAAGIKTGLEEWYGQDTIDVTGTNPWTIEWVGTQAETLIPRLKVTSALWAAGIAFTPGRLINPRAGVNEVQSLYYLGGYDNMPTGGTYTLSFGGQTTGAIPCDAEPSSIEAHLNSLPMLGDFGGVTVTQTTPYSWLIRFTGAGLKYRDQPLIAVDGSYLVTAAYTPTVAETVKGKPPRNEIHEFSTATDAVSGTWNLNFKGSTVTLNYNDSAADVETALEAIYGADCALVTKGPLPLQPVRVEWDDVYGLSVQPASTTATWVLRPVTGAEGMTAGAYVAGTTGQDAQHRFTAPANAVGGTWAIVAAGQTSSTLGWNCAAADAQTALEAIVGADNVTFTGGPFPATPLVVTYVGEMAKEDIAAPTAASYIACRYSTFTITTVQQGDPGTSMIFETITPNSGPNVWSDVVNWDGNIVAVAGDDLVLHGRNVSLFYNLPQDWPHFASITFASYTGEIGLPDIDDTNSANIYNQYRPRALCCTADVWKIGFGEGGGMPFARIDLGNGTQPSLIYIDATGQPKANLRALMFTGGNADTTAYIRYGSVAFAFYPGENAVLDAINSSYKTLLTDVDLYLGTGLAVGTIKADGGRLVLYCSYDTLEASQSNVYQYAGAPGDVTLHDYTWFYYQTPEDGGDFIVAGMAILDFSHGMEPVSIDSLDGEKYDPMNRVTVLT